MAESIFSHFISNLKHFMIKVDSIFDSERHHIKKPTNLNLSLSKLEEIFQHDQIDIKPDRSHDAKNKRKLLKRKSLNDLVLSSNIKSNRQYWSKNHDNFLLKIVYAYSNNWKKIQKRIIKIYNLKFDIEFLKEKYFHLKMNVEEKKGRFSIEEDHQLLKLVDEHGKNWIKISEFFEKRNPTMIKNRYYYFLNSRRTEKYQRN